MARGKVVPDNLNGPIKASAHLPLISENRLRVHLSSFGSRNSAGYDGVSISYLRRDFGTLTDVLLFTLDHFLQVGFIPEELKGAIVKPLYKKWNSHSR